MPYVVFALVACVSPPVFLTRFRPAWAPKIAFAGSGIIGALLWLHGVWFDPHFRGNPFEAWFTPTAGFQIKAHFSFFMAASAPALIVLALGLAAYRFYRKGDEDAPGVGHLSWATGCWVLAGVVLRAIPVLLTDARTHDMDSTKTVDGFFEGSLPRTFLNVLAVAAVLVLIGWRVSRTWRWATVPPPPPHPIDDDR